MFKKKEKENLLDEYRVKGVISPEKAEEICNRQYSEGYELVSASGTGATYLMFFNKRSTLLPPQAKSN